MAVRGLVDDAWDLAPVVLADLPFAAYYNRRLRAPTPPVPPGPPAPGPAGPGGGVPLFKEPKRPRPVRSEPVSLEALVAAPPALLSGGVRCDPDELLAGEDSLLF